MLLLVSGLFLVLWRNVEAAAADSGLKPTEKNEVCFTKAGKIPYNPDTQTCCIDGVKEGAENKHICKTCGSTMFAMPKDGPTWRCCGSKRDVPYNPESHHCCFGNVREGPEEETACFRCGKNVVSIPEKEADDWMCCGKKNTPYNTKKEHCCFGEVKDGSDEKFQCQKCGKKVFSKPKSDPSWRCCGKKNDMPYNPDTHHCCFHEVKEGSQKEHMCQRCGDNVFSKMISEPSYKCCGPQMEPYNPHSHHCCFNEVRKGSEKKNVCQRCGANVFSRPASDQSWWCCGSKDLPYNPTSHTCCGGDVLKGPDGDNVCQKCGDVSFLRPKTDPRWNCCGDDNTPYNPKTHYCCFGKLMDGAESQYTCLKCGKKVSTVPSNGPVWGCCADLAYNTEKQVCCKDEVYQGTKCNAPGIKPASDVERTAIGRTRREERVVNGWTGLLGPAGPLQMPSLPSSVLKLNKHTVVSLSPSIHKHTDLLTRMSYNRPLCPADAVFILSSNNLAFLFPLCQYLGQVSLSVPRISGREEYLAEQTKQGEDPGAYSADRQGSEPAKEPAFKPEGEEAGTGGCSVNTGGRQSATQICCGNRSGAALLSPPIVPHTLPSGYRSINDTKQPRCSSGQGHQVIP
ncbi:hypothetical protein Bbelb_212670 [Branchiostoma belcheri]|nr:hypothetical protein Bbelb_212670 [Branchiostoma belcheri]